MKRLSWWLSLAVVALVVRLGCFCYLYRSNQLRLGEGYLTLALAKSVASGRGFSLPRRVLRAGPEEGPIVRRTLDEWRKVDGVWGVARPERPTAYLSPGYPVVLAALGLVMGGPEIGPVVVLQCILGAITCVVVVLVGRRILGERAARCVGWAAAVYPVLVYQACDVADHCLFTLLLLLWILAFLSVRTDDTGIRWFGVGVLGGVVFLVRPLPMAILPLMLMWVWWRGVRRKAVAAVLLLSGFAVSVSPWVVRNSLVMGRPLLLPTKGGRNMWEFNNARFSSYFLWSEPAATLRRYRPLRDKYLPTLRRRDLVEFPAFTNETELERDAILQSRVRAFLLANPTLYAELCLARVTDFFRLVPIHARDTLQRLAVAVPSGFVLALAFVGALMAARKGPAHARFLVLLISLYAGVHVLTVAGLTFRIPIEPYMLVLAVYGASGLVGALPRPDRVCGMTSRDT